MTDYLDIQGNNKSSQNHDVLQPFCISLNLKPVKTIWFLFILFIESVYAYLMKIITFCLFPKSVK